MSPGHRFYALLLRLLPADFRERHGSELLGEFDDMRSELGRRPGALQLGRFYAGLTLDLLRRVRPERNRALRRNWDGPRSTAGGSRGLRQIGRGLLLDRLLTDIRLAARSLARRPLFLLVATLSLAIGIGANTAIFSVLNAVFLRQYPYRAPAELVRVYTDVPNRTVYGSTSYPNYRDLRGFDAAFQAVGAYKTIFSRIELREETARVVGEGISHTLLPMLGVEAALGRSFLPEEDEVPGAHPVMMVGHGFWQRAFGGDPEIVGRTVRLGGQSFTVVGVTPEGFHGLSGAGVAADFFVPLVMHGVITGFTGHSHFENRLDRRYYVLGRMAEGMTVAGVRARLEVLSRQIRAANPETGQEWKFAVLPMQDVALAPDIDRAILPFVMLLLGAGGLVLLLACTNLASFLLARGLERRREVAIRLALGAGRSALVRQLLTETALLASLGGASGLLVARATLDLLIRVQPSLPAPITLELGLDSTVLLFTFGVSALAGLLFGMAPAIQSTNPTLVPALKDETGPVRRRRFGLRGGLVAFQMGISVVLLVGGGLAVRSLGAARQADLGFSTRKAGVVWVDLSISGVPPSDYAVLREELTLQARALPGIDAATSAGHIPLDIIFGASGRFYTIPGADPPARGSGHNVQRGEVDPAFFETMGIPLVMGRGFSEEDRRESPRVAIVNETAARRFWPGESPLGREFSPLDTEEVIRVVGVARDTRIERLRETQKPFFYFPVAQRPDPDVVLVARGEPAPEEITAMLRRMIRGVDPDLTIMEAKTMEEHVGLILFPARMAALLLGLFGALALTLATVGLYGVVSFSVSQRTQEVGIRLSLGADARRVVAMVMGGAMRLVGVGGTLGLAAALGLSQLIRHYLYGVGPWDPLTILGVPLLLGSVAFGAALVPARRASRVNPVEAMRRE